MQPCEAERSLCLGMLQRGGKGLLNRPQKGKCAKARGRGMPSKANETKQNEEHAAREQLSYMGGGAKGKHACWLWLEDSLLLLTSPAHTGDAAVRAQLPRLQAPWAVWVVC